MAKKSTKISVMKLYETVKDMIGIEDEFEWNGLSVRVKRNLSLAEMLYFSDAVVKGCFSEDGLRYMPESRDFAVRMAVITFYTNITLPRSHEKTYDILYDTELVADVTELIDKKQFGVMMSAIDEKISLMTDINAAAIRQQIDEIHNAMTNMQSTVESYASGIDMNDVKSLLSAFAGGSFDEQKLLDAVIKSRSEEE